MYKKGTKEKETETNAIADEAEESSPRGTAVDFILKTAIQRAGVSGKRQIRPKNVDDLLNADIQEPGSDEDPDFDVFKDKHHNESDVSIASEEEEETMPDEEGSMDNNPDISDEDDASYKASDNNDCEGSDSSSDESEETNNDDSDAEDNSSSDDGLQSPIHQKSTIRETLQKLKESEFPPRKKFKKKVTKKTSSGSSKANPLSKESKGKVLKSNKRKGKSDSSCKTEQDKRSTKKKMVLESKRRKEVQSKKNKDKNVTDSKRRSIMEMVDELSKSHKENRENMLLGNAICSACLGKASDDLNEIVECDSCGITVHEACYGINDAVSISSGSGSSSSTEPWFCDACKTGAKYISCELCPMKGGLYKETTVGRWVHLVCSMYTPGVLYTDGSPNLMDIPYSKWGAQTCSVCDDIRYSRSGICIQCDAGMCKTYLHATCAQKHGLLSDPILQSTISNEMEADPYYAACKLHTNRDAARRRAKTYGVLQEQLRIKQYRKLSNNMSEEDQRSHQRIQRKLEKIRFKVAIKQAHTNTVVLPKYPAPFTNNGNNGANLSVEDGAAQVFSNNNIVKKSRLLPTSAGSASSFLKKAELMGLDIKTMELEDKHTRIISSVKKKWNVPPSLGVEFAAYYADREVRIRNSHKECEAALKEKENFCKHLSTVENDFDVSQVNMMAMQEDNDRIKTDLFSLGSALKSVLQHSSAPKKLITKLNSIFSDCGISKRRSPSQSQKRSSASPPKSSNAKRSSDQQSVSTGETKDIKTERLSIKVCSVCEQTEGQPWIIRCDQCTKFYHLQCLDPPLTRMPKRSKQCGWMCSDCFEEELESEEPPVDTEAPRTLRGRTKIRKPGKYRNSTDSREGDSKKLAKLPLSSLSSVDSSVVSNPVAEVSTSGGSIILKQETPPMLPNGDVKSRKRKSLITASTSKTDPDGPVIKRSKANNAAETSEQSDGSKKPQKPRKPRTPKSSLVSSGVVDSAVMNPLSENKFSVVKSSHAEETDTGKKKPRKKKEMNGESEILKSFPPNGMPVDGNLCNSFPKATKRPKKEKGLLNSTNEKSGKPKKEKKKSAKQIALDKERERIIMGNMMAAAVEVKRKEDTSLASGSLNGNGVVGVNVSRPPAVPAVGIKRKSKVGGNAEVLENGVPPPPKKRKKKSQNPHPENTNEDAVIDAVAMGNFDGSPKQTKGSSDATPPAKSGNKIVTTKQWNEEPSEPPEDHSIMKGHAMGATCSSGEVVTVNASDLLDLVEPDVGAAVSSSTGFTPGFYSSTISAEQSEESQVASAAQPTQSTDSANVIKLIYEAPTSSSDNANNKLVSHKNSSQQHLDASGNSEKDGKLYPTLPKPSSTMHEVCFSCQTEDLRRNLVACDKCSDYIHPECYVLPLIYIPKRRGFPWFCFRCEEENRKLAEGGLERVDGRKELTSISACGNTKESFTLMENGDASSS